MKIESTRKRRRKTRKQRTCCSWASCIMFLSACALFGISSFQLYTIATSPLPKKHALPDFGSSPKQAKKEIPKTDPVSKVPEKFLNHSDFHSYPVVPLLDNDYWKRNSADMDTTFIPRRLIFVHAHNILERREPEHLYENLKKTIQTYALAWEQPLDQMEVLFFDDICCRNYIEHIEPRLLLPFDTETFGAYKSDICRIVALHVHGGIYLDNDNQMLRAVVPSKNIDFVTIDAHQKYQFTNSIIAVPPKHRILREVLDSMIHDWYYNTKLMNNFNLANAFDPAVFYEEAFQSSLQIQIRDSLLQEKQIQTADSVTFHMGPTTLRLGYDNFVHRRDGSTTSWFLQEIFNGGLGKNHIYPNLYRRSTAWGCNFVVHDNTTRTAYYYSRCRGTEACPN